MTPFRDFNTPRARMFYRFYVPGACPIVFLAVNCWTSFLCMMPRSNRRLYRTSTKKKAVPKPATPPPTPQSTAPSSPPTSFGAALVHGVTSGVGWGMGTSAMKAVFGLGSSSSDNGDTSATSAAREVKDPSSSTPTLPTDACGTLWLAYQRCIYDSGGRACDPVKEGFEAVCPGFQAPLEGVVREATPPAYVLSLPPV